jgi:hypothetical protein
VTHDGVKPGVHRELGPNTARGQRWLGFRVVLDDLAWSYKVDDEAARAPAQRIPEAVWHVADGGANRRRGGCRWRLV